MNFKISLFFKGMLMGIAEIIPGVSGGTLAFITGIYQELINSIKSINIESIRVLTKFQFKKFWTNINGSFLLTLLIGMITSILLLSRLITFLALPESQYFLLLSWAKARQVHRLINPVINSFLVIKM